MATLIFGNPLIFQEGTGLSITPGGTELFGKQSRTVTFSIGQAVATTSNVEFNVVTGSSVVTDNGTLILKGNTISGSFTQTGNFTTSTNMTVNNDFTIGGKLTAEEYQTEVTKSVTLFESGSTIFGNSTDDNHFITGSIHSTGSITLNGYKITEISNDTTLGDESTTSLITEKAAGSYATLNTATINTYQRKSFAHTGSFVSVSTASFTVVTASAPSGYTGTTVNDFMFFLNGVIMENDALNIEQSGSTFLLKVNNNSLGYNLEDIDEIVGFGKFNS